MHTAIVNTKGPELAHADTDRAHPGDRRIGALLLIRSRAGSILLVQPSYRPPAHMQLVGGGTHPGERVTEAALREAIEETNLTGLAVGQLLLVDQVAASPAGSAEGYNFIFDGGLVDDEAAINLPAARPGADPELTSWAWVAPEHLGEVCQPAQHRRIAAALTVLVDPDASRCLFEGRPC